MSVDCPDCTAAREILVALEGCPEAKAWVESFDASARDWGAGNMPHPVTLAKALVLLHGQRRGAIVELVLDPARIIEAEENTYAALHWTRSGFGDNHRLAVALKTKPVKENSDDGT